jgi:predicted O-methyltransferase YrrM
MMLLHKLRQVTRALKWRRQVAQAVSTQLSLLEDPDALALGSLAAADEERLTQLVQRAAAHAGPIVEFGTLFGITTRLIAARARPGQRVITIDNFSWNPFGLPPPVHERFTRGVLRTELAEGRVELWVGGSADYRGGDRGPVPALVFLDADHSYAAVRDEIAWARRRGVPIICGHDYGAARFGVTRAVDEAFGREAVTAAGSVWSWEQPA